MARGSWGLHSGSNLATVTGQAIDCLHLDLQTPGHHVREQGLTVLEDGRVQVRSVNNMYERAGAPPLAARTGLFLFSLLPDGDLAVDWSVTYEAFGSGLRAEDEFGNTLLRRE